MISVTVHYVSTYVYIRMSIHTYIHTYIHIISLLSTEMWSLHTYICMYITLCTYVHHRDIQLCTSTSNNLLNFLPISLTRICNPMMCLYVYIRICMYGKYFQRNYVHVIKTHDSESRGQEEAAYATAE